MKHTKTPMIFCIYAWILEIIVMLDTRLSIL